VASRSTCFAQLRAALLTDGLENVNMIIYGVYPTHASISDVIFLSDKGDGKWNSYVYTVKGEHKAHPIESTPKNPASL
jgi:hypothetical protein